MYQYLLYEEIGNIAKLTLNRPECFNALNAGLKEELTHAFTAVQENPNLQGLLLTGAGDKAFCAGQDLHDSMGLGPEDAEGWVRSFDSLYTVIRAFTKPYVAAVNGVSAGSGFQLPLLADVIVCADTARFAMTEIDVGYACIIGTTLLWDILGRARTTNLILSGGFISAKQAVEWGLACEAVPLAALPERSLEIVSQLAEKPPVALASNKKWFRTLTEERFNQCIDFAIDAHIAGYEAGEPNRGQQAFFEKRKQA